MGKPAVFAELPNSVTLVDGAGGLPLLSVSTPAAAGEVYFHGAQISGWTPAGNDAVIWMSKGSAFAPAEPIRGGVPICFPWFGPGRRGGMSPVHGFAKGSFCPNKFSGEGSSSGGSGLIQTSSF
jgi:glucose-6-phosphate 1-epimerase